ncbi:MAG: hypothetical protein LQ340_007900 [Diploschistes diacapsis]|nr:MAG: hypothetical protein LQ340_007900 [Diploschistes diacapsis]
MSSTYKTIVLASRPKGHIVPEEQFKLIEKPRLTEADLKDDQVLLETLYLSLDPAMRGWMNGNHCTLTLNSTSSHILIHAFPQTTKTTLLTHIQRAVPTSPPSA